MSHRIIAFVLLVAFAMQSFQQNLIVLDYVANTVAYIEACINKDKPELKCKGKCQLMKKLQEEEKKNNQSPDHKGENKGQTLYNAPLVAFTLPQPHTQATIYQTFAVPPPKDRPTTIFHPPALL
mgnify:FL=1